VGCDRNSISHSKELNQRQSQLKYFFMRLLKTLDHLKKLPIRVDWEIFVLLVLPLVLLLVNNEWIFTNAFAGYIDSWMYLGYFVDFVKHLQTYRLGYYGTRLSWIIPGYLIYETFPPMVANYVLHLLVYYLSTISLYFLLKLTLDRRVGLLCAILMGFYAPFLQAVGWDYPDGIGIGYFLLALLMLTYAAKFARWQLFLGLAGASYAALVYSNLYWVPFFPPLVIHYLVLNRQHRKNPVFKSALFFVVGILALTVALGIFNYTHDKQFLFFMPTIRYLMSIRFNRSAHYYDASFDWVFTRAWIYPIGLVSFASLIFLIFNWRQRSEASDRIRLLYQFNLLLFVLIMIFWESRGWPAIQYFYYASSVIPCLFLAIAAQIYPLTKRLNSWQFFVVVAASMLMIPTVKFFSLALWLYHRFSVILVFSLVLLIVAFLVRYRYKAAVGFFALVFAMVAFTSFNMAYFGGTIFSGTQYGPRSDAFMAVVKGSNVIKTNVPEIKRIVRQNKRLFWYDVDSEYGRLYQAIASTYLWHGLMVNESFPSMHDMVLNVTPIQVVTPGSKLIIFSQQTDPTQILKQADEGLKKINQQAKFLNQERIQSGNLDFTMTIIETVEKPSKEIGRSQELGQKSGGVDLTS
jgi:hypothetical protein